MDELTLRVDGRPPPKSEARSVFAQGGKYEARVRKLLAAAAEALEGGGKGGFGAARLRLEVEVRTGPGEPPWDATNYLGGIADVLETKSKRKIAHPGLIDHLGPLAEVGLYDDDRQIKEIFYREVKSSSNEYLVTLRPID